MLAPYVDNVVGEGRAGRTVVVETGNTAVDVERGRIEVLVLQWRLLARACMQCLVKRAYLHELLKSSTLKGLALVRGSVTRHDGLLALRDLVPEAWWCG